MSGSIKSLIEVENLIKLTDFKVLHSNKLEDIKSLSNLQNLHIEKCKLLIDFSFLSSNKKYLLIT